VCGVCTVRRDVTIRAAAVSERLRPIPTLDAFAGCGGLTEGFRQTHVFDCVQAVEFAQMAAEAFKANHDRTVVSCEDINFLMHRLLHPTAPLLPGSDATAPPLPSKGRAMMQVRPRRRVCAVSYHPDCAHSRLPCHRGCRRAVPRARASVA